MEFAKMFFVRKNYIFFEPDRTISAVIGLASDFYKAIFLKGNGSVIFEKL